MAESHGVVQEGDAVLLRCDKVYKPAVAINGRLVKWCVLFRIGDQPFVLQAC